MLGRCCSLSPAVIGREAGLPLHRRDTRARRSSIHSCSRHRFTGSLRTAGGSWNTGEYPLRRRDNMQTPHRKAPAAGRSSAVRRHRYLRRHVVPTNFQKPADRLMTGAAAARLSVRLMWPAVVSQITMFRARLPILCSFH